MNFWVGLAMGVAIGLAPLIWLVCDIIRGYGPALNRRQWKELDER